MEINPIASSSKGNCYHVSDGVTEILIEAGIPWKQIQRKLAYKTNNIQACLVSHCHMDHGGRVNEVIKAGIDVFSSQQMFEALGLTGHRVHPVESMQQFTVGSLVIMPFDLEHDVKNLGYIIYSNALNKKLVFITDTYFCRYKFTELNFIMIEANFSNEILNANVTSGKLHKSLKTRLLRSHFSIENVKEFFKANDLSKVEEIYLLHLSDGNSNAKQFKEEIEKLTGIPVKVC